MKSIELFAGAGGLGIGLHESGFHPLNVIEWDQYCCDTIRENKLRNVECVSNWNLTEEDIRLIDFRQYEGRVHLVSGGPPCQPFSLGGRHHAYDDHRDMFPHAIRAVREAKPSAFIFENVKGLTRPSFRNYFEYIKLQLTYPEVVVRKSEDWMAHHARLEQHHTSRYGSGFKYNVVTQVLNAANYGIPQKRERVFFVGFRSDLDIRWSFPKETHSLESLQWDMQHGDYWDRHDVPKRERIFPRGMKRLSGKPVKKAWRTVRDALSGLPDPELRPEESCEFPNHRFQPGARSYPGHTGSAMDEPAKTLKAGVHGVPGGENMLLRPNGKVRYFSVRESARLQTFPDEFVFHGSWTETMRQLGNAVPVKLAQLIGRHVANKIREPLNKHLSS